MKDHCLSVPLNDACCIETISPDLTEKGHVFESELPDIPSISEHCRGLHRTQVDRRCGPELSNPWSCIAVVYDSTGPSNPELPGDRIA
jgi:hypothetical protein